MLCVSDCIADRVSSIIHEPSEGQHIRNQTRSFKAPALAAATLILPATKRAMFGSQARETAEDQGNIRAVKSEKGSCLEGFQPPTFWSEVRSSIRRSYRPKP